MLEITIDDYHENIGSKLRFDTVVKLYNMYKKNKKDLLVELRKLRKDPKRGMRYLIRILYLICEGKDDSLNISLLTSLLYRTRPKLKTVINDARKFYSRDINLLIANAIRIKNSYIEHSFYIKVSIIRYFMILEKCNSQLIDVMSGKIINTIDFLYFINSKHKKMLSDLGIYERDIDYVLGVIGNQFKDSFELKDLLIQNEAKLSNVSYLSKYVIQNLK